MKKCPQCKTIYTDSTLTYCLSDGTPLVSQSTEAETEQFSNLVVDINTQNKTSQPTQASNRPTEETIVKTAPTAKVKSGVSPIWVFTTFALFVLIITGSIVTWLIISQDSNRKNTDFKTDSNSVNGKNSSSVNLGTNFENSEKNSDEKPKETKEKLYRVSGVKSNDVLYIRPQAGNLKVVAGRIPPDGKGIKIIGGNKKVGKSRWVYINYNGTRGWVNRNFLTDQNK
jgi:hypothetical protein